MDPTVSAALNAGSPAFSAGVALTTVSASDTGSGTSLVVNDPLLLPAGLGWHAGRLDCVGASMTAQIVSINYSTNMLTLASAITRSPGAPVYLYKDSAGAVVLYGSLPSVGAYQVGGAPAAPTGLGLTLGP